MSIKRRNRKPLPISEAKRRFWKRVRKTPACWEWTGARTHGGYGVLRYQGRYVRAHRLAYELTRDDIPEGMSVCHDCDNPPCVRPDHLFLATHAENVQDMNNKGRGSGRFVAERLTDKDVRDIRQLFARGYTNIDIAQRYSVNDSYISMIRTGKRRYNVA